MSSELALIFPSVRPGDFQALPQPGHLVLLQLSVRLLLLATVGSSTIPLATSSPFSTSSSSALAGLPSFVRDSSIDVLESPSAAVSIISITSDVQSLSLPSI